jgi:predicted dehydrogenase
MIGAGNIMFGSDQGPWNHSFRLEHKLGPRLKVKALIDPNVARAKEILAKKCASFVEQAYKDTIVYKSLDEYAAALKAEGGAEPKAIIIGAPPAFRGGVSKGRNLEIDLIKFFPKVAYFIEKPVSAGPVAETWEVAEDLVKNNNIVSVGYMLRYLRCVQKMKQIIHENNLVVMATNARYSAAYESIDKLAWWDKSKDMGPVIEQGTHFCDLSRYFGGDVNMDSVV